MRRRQALRLIGVAAAAPLAGCTEGAIQPFADIAAARRAVDALVAAGGRSRGAWSLAQALHHAAQSIEFSLHGFPQPKSALFQATVGQAAIAVFSARGQMSHSLSEPIPGAPALPTDEPVAQAAARLQQAWQAFEAHTGPLAPHFAYGPLDKAAYTRAHLMHLANHWTEFTTEKA
ncbi:MAG: hypothetical protein CFE45_24690 [Burkholderiales bacterium PBB5]|nr:MAG: hypothetical protein CFE45_24690 [Burkholderiales bacterium PBB5]